MATTIELGIQKKDWALGTEAGLRRASLRRNRRISAEAGHALEVLGHAIEYLTDEYVHETRELSATDSQVDAIQILMSLNRRIYFECRVVPTFTEQFCAFLQGTRA
jgi:hypothetical protein